jgi:predicted nuclease of restriction endonuclease-like RecB superfamily
VPSRKLAGLMPTKVRVSSNTSSPLDPSGLLRLFVILNPASNSSETITKRKIMKFKNKPKGKFRSTLEHEISKSMPRRRGVKIRYESHTISYSIPKVYMPDFTVTLPSGKVFHIEVKGWFRQEDKAKMKYVKLCNPEVDIRMVFPRKNKKDITWCEKNGFPYSVGIVPKEWFYA